jgi:hypothetical protein
MSTHPSRKFADSSMALLITLITLVEGGLSRPFEILPREWRACRLSSSIGGALANVRHRRVGTVSSLSSIELTLNGAAALTGKTQSAHQERHQYWIAIAMQPFCQTSEATDHAVPPAAPTIRSRGPPWFSLVAGGGASFLKVRCLV